MKRVTALLLMFLLVATVLCGCKDGKAPNGNGENSGGAPSSENVTQAGGDETSTTPKYGGTVTVGITQDIDSLDPHKVTSAGTREVLYNVYEGLVKPDVDGNMVPAVAGEYKISADSLTYTSGIDSKNDFIINILKILMAPGTTMAQIVLVHPSA